MMDAGRVWRFVGVGVVGSSGKSRSLLGEGMGAGADVRPLSLDGENESTSNELDRPNLCVG